MLFGRQFVNLDKDVADTLTAALRAMSKAGAVNKEKYLEARPDVVLTFEVPRLCLWRITTVNEVLAALGWEMLWDTERGRKAVLRLKEDR